MVMRLSAAVQLTDDLTGLPITGSNARVWIEGQKPPIKKNDGRSIFVDLPEGEHILIAEGGIYARTEVPCRVSPGKFESITIRLLPNKLYPVPSDTVRIEGKAAPGALVRIYSADRAKAFKLLSDAEEGSDTIGIYHAAGINIEGKLLKIITSDDKQEYIRIASAENAENSEYFLTEKLSSGYAKIGTVIVPVSECRADDRGEFMLLMKAGAEKEVICEVQGEKGPVQKKTDIGGSSYIKTDLTE